MSEKKMSLKFQVFTNLCMSSFDLTTPEDILKAVKENYEYITEGVDFSEPQSENPGQIVPIRPN